MLERIAQDIDRRLDQALPSELRIPDIPLEPCETFRGRIDVLKKMEDFFYGGSWETRKRKIFAICGLGMFILFLHVTRFANLLS